MKELNRDELLKVLGGDDTTPPEDPNDSDRRRAPDDGWRIEVGD